MLQDYEAVRYMGAKGNFSVTKELPPGRGFLVKAVSAALVQIGMADVDGVDGRTAQEQLDGLIGAIRARYQPAKWSYYAADLTALDKAIRGEEARRPPRPGAPPPEAQSTTDAMAAIAELMKMQAGMTGSLGTVAEANPLNFASVRSRCRTTADGNGSQWRATAPTAATAPDGGNGAHAEQAAPTATAPAAAPNSRRPDAMDRMNLNLDIQSGSVGVKKVNLRSSLLVDNLIATIKDKFNLDGEFELRMSTTARQALPPGLELDRAGVTDGAVLVVHAHHAIHRHAWTPSGAACARG